MSVKFSAPFPKTKVETTFPDPEFADARATQSRGQIKRTMTGETYTYGTASTKVDLRYRFFITRQKDLEFDQLLRVYHAATWKIVDHRGDVWEAQLIGRPISRKAARKIDSDTTRTGGEEMDITLFFSAEKIS